MASKIMTFAEQLQAQPALLKRFQQEFPQLEKVSSQRVVRVQAKGALSDDQASQVQELLLEGSGEKVSREQVTHGHFFEISYQPAIRDPEHTAIWKILKTHELDQALEAVKFSTVYVFEGVEEEQAEQIVDKYLFNKLLHVLVREEPDHLKVSSAAEGTQIIEGFCELNLRELKELSDARSWYMEDWVLEEVQRKFRDDLKRDPSDAEVEYLAQRTSDHCFHTTWKSLGLFKKLKGSVDQVLPKREDIVSVFVDNSGVMSSSLEPSTNNHEPITYLIKGETHNSPTAIAPVGGVETMHGGCIRDIMGTGQGGFPTMATQVFIVGSQTKEEMSEEYNVESFLDPLVILRGMIQGVQNYGNPMGIPNFGGRVFRHPAFFGKPLALGICLGTGERAYSKKGTPEAGDIALLVGNPTGRDGIHGATMSSAANTEQTVKKEGAAVQIGDPYTERLIMEATPELRSLLRAYGDMGAGGIASCFGEMGEGVGLEIDLEHIPVKYEGLSPWEKLESESQERMGMAVDPKQLAQVKKILDEHEVPYHELGTFTGANRFVVKHGAETIVDLDYEWLEDFPIPKKEVEQWIDQHEEEEGELELKGASMKELVLEILKHSDLADQSIFFRRWDSTVQGKTMRESLAPFTNMPYDQGIYVPDAESGVTQVLSLTCNPWWSGNPFNMAVASFIGTVSKQISAGVKRTKIAMCDNFYTPKSTSKSDWQLTEMVRAITDLMIDLETPAISGKDSSSGTSKIPRKDGTTEAFEIVPTICMSAMGAGADFRKVPPKQLQKAGNELRFIEAGIKNDMSGSVVLEPWVRGKHFNYEVDIQEYKKTIDQLASLIEQGKILSISVVDDGGIVHRLFEMMLGSGLGVELDRLFGISTEQEVSDGASGEIFGGQKAMELLLKAQPGTFIVEVANQEDLGAIESVLLGTVISEPELKMNGEVLTLKEMKETWQQPWYDILQLKREHQEVAAPVNPLPFSPSKVTKKKVNVVYSSGINCHQEMVRAWIKLGCDTQLISVTNPGAKFADADIVVFPGGFADGDYLGSAKVWHELMETQFKDQMDYLRTGKIPVLGICNGFQLMTRSGFFGQGLKLTFNDSGVFEQRWVRATFSEQSEQSIWTKGMQGMELVVPVAHGEGKFVMEGKMTEASISLSYEPAGYPNNPNGSVQNIAGVFAGDRGQFWGGMPHPERAIEDYHFTQHGLVFFENVLKNL